MKIFFGLIVILIALILNPGCKGRGSSGKTSGNENEGQLSQIPGLQV